MIYSLLKVLLGKEICIHKFRELLVLTPISKEPNTKGDPSTGTYVIPRAPTSFVNCTAMRAYYPNGVKKGHPAYANARDGDKDGWACER